MEYSAIRFRLIAAGILLASLFSIPSNAASQSPGIKRVILISVDSMNNSYLFDPSRNPDFKYTPNMGKLVIGGAYYRTALSALPSVTQTNHLTMVCGSFSDKIGFAGNRIYKRGSGGYGIDPWRRPEQYIKCQTLMQAVKEKKPEIVTAVVAGKNFVGCPLKADYNIGPSCVSDSVRKVLPRIRPFPELALWDAPDRWVMDNALHVLETVKPNFMLLHLGFLDPVQHNFGHGSAEAWAALEWADTQIGRLLKYLNDNNMYRDTLIILTADHGQASTWDTFDLKTALKKQGIAVEFVNADGPFAEIFLKDPAQAKKAAEFLGGLDFVTEVWVGDQIAAAHLSTPFSGDVIVALYPKYDPGFIYFHGLSFRGNHLGQHGGLFTREVPLVFYGPGIIPGEYSATGNFSPILPPGSTIPFLSPPTLADIVPTIVELTGWPMPKDVQGMALPFAFEKSPSAPVAINETTALEAPKTSIGFIAPMFWIVSIVLLIGGLAIQTSERGLLAELARGLMFLAAIAAAISALRFVQFQALYSGVPGLGPDRLLCGKAMLLWGAAIVSVPWVQTLCWLAVWIIGGIIIGLMARFIAQARMIPILVRLPNVFIPWIVLTQLLTLAHFIHAFAVPRVVLLCRIGWWGGLAGAVISLVPLQMKDEDAQRGGIIIVALITAAIVAALQIFLPGIPIVRDLLGVLSCAP